MCIVPAKETHTLPSPQPLAATNLLSVLVTAKTQSRTICGLWGLRGIDRSVRLVHVVSASPFTEHLQNDNWGGEGECGTYGESTPSRRCGVRRGAQMVAPRA